MLALTGDESRGGCGSVGGCLGVFFVAHGLRRWCLGVVHLWLAILCWLGGLPRGVACIFESCAGRIFMKGLILSSVYTRLDL